MKMSQPNRPGIVEPVDGLDAKRTHPNAFVCQ